MGKIVAVVAVNKQQIGGGAPIFFASTAEEQQQIAFSLEKILDAAAHDLKNGLLVLVNHSQ